VQGDLANDSHTEVIARRVLLLWLYAEIQAAVSQVTDFGQALAWRCMLQLAVQELAISPSVQQYIICDLYVLHTAGVRPC